MDPDAVKKEPAAERPPRCRLLRDFARNTSLHGLHYVGEDERTLVEKIWWTAMFTLSALACFHLIREVWLKWQTIPVIVTFEEAFTPVWKIPFPAVTVCSRARLKRSAFDFSGHLQRVREGVRPAAEESRKYEVLSLLCENPIADKGSPTASQADVDYLRQVSPTIEESLSDCKWKNVHNRCEMFSPILTEHGTCFSFNMLDASELFNAGSMYEGYDYLDHGKLTEGWTLDGGYPSYLPLDTYPRRGMYTSNGPRSGIELELRTNLSDVDYACGGLAGAQGYSVFLHTPAEMPRTPQFRVPLGQEVVATVRPSVMTTSEGLRGYSILRRQCIFSSERRLRFYSEYTQTNCEVECLANYTLLACGCVSYAMPRNSSMPICSARKIECMLRAEDHMYAYGAEEGIAESGTAEAQQEYTAAELGAMPAPERALATCDCWPACTSVSYEVDAAHDRLPRRQSPANVSVSHLIVYFRDSQFISSRRSELYGLTDFLANCGGLLGLFLGFSFLSLVEIIYFLTLRPFIKFRSGREPRSPLQQETEPSGDAGSSPRDETY